MNAVPFNTLALARALRDKAHMTPEQAEGVSDALAEAFQDDIATKNDIANLRSAVSADISELKADINELRVTTKADINELRSELKADINELRATTKASIDELRATTKADINELRATTRADINELRSEIKQLELRMTVKLGGMLVVTVGVLAAIKFFA
jgi:SMC interacting uncharacterized protein involved in chromosome segregation